MCVGFQNMKLIIILNRNSDTIYFSTHFFFNSILDKK